MKGFKNCLAGALRWVITLVFVAGLLILPASKAVAAQSQKDASPALQPQEASSDSIPLSSTDLTSSSSTMFSDDFLVDPNTSGKWTIYRNANDAANEASWNSADGTIYVVRADDWIGTAIFANYDLTSRQWEAEFRYKIGGGTGADGLVFMFYKNKQQYTPGYGGRLAFSKSDENPVAGYGVEFGNWYNGEYNDPSGSHIAIIKNHVGTHLASVNDSRTEDNQWHTALIQYNDGTVSVYVDDGLVLIYTIADPDYTYTGIGLSASTGAYNHNHVVDDFVVRGTSTSTICGTVSDQSGDPIPDAQVCAYPYDPVGTGYCVGTDPDGNYTIDELHTGSYHLSAEASDWAFEFYNNTYDYDSATPVLVTAETTTTNINFTLELAGRITGIVRNSSGDPIPDAQVCTTVDTGEWPYCSKTTNTDGAYTIDGLHTGNYRVAASASGWVSEYYNNTYNYDSATPVSVTAGATTTAINFTLEPSGRIYGWVTDASGNPIPDAQVCASPVDTGWGGCDQTLADGTYIIDGLLTGNYRLDVQASGWASEYYEDKYDWDAATLVSVTSGATTTNINFTLEPAGRISGTVRDASGNPISGADVCANSYDTPKMGGCAQSNANGTYTIDGLHTGNYRLDVHASGWASEFYNNTYDWDSVTPVLVTIGENTTNINFTLEPAGRISGVVRNASGNPISGAWVCADACDTINVGGCGPTTGMDGTYSIDGLRTGSYRINAGADGYASKFYNNTYSYDLAAPVQVTAGATTTNINFSLEQGGSVSGMVQDASGNPIPDVTISDEAGHKTVTDSNGKYTLSVLTGTHTITASKKGYIFSPDSPIVSVPPDVSEQNFVGSVAAADIGYAVLVAGHGGVREQWGISQNANKAYQALHSLGFDDDRILYLNSDLLQDPDGDGEPEVDWAPSSNGFRLAMGWARLRVGEHSPFILYLVGHGEKDEFYLGSDISDSLFASKLNEWLDQLPKGTQMLIVIDACYSGSFITAPDSISAENRIVVTSAHDDQKVITDLGYSFFSHDFWQYVQEGENIKQAFIKGAESANELLKRIAIVGKSWDPWLAENGDTEGHSPESMGDYGQLAATMILGVPGLPPSVGQDALNSQLFKDSYNRNGGALIIGNPINKVHRWGNGYIQDFRGGEGYEGALMEPDGAKDVYAVYGSIWSKYLVLGGAEGSLGYPLIDETECPASSITSARCRYSKFVGGAIVHRNAISSYDVKTVFLGWGIFNRWEQLNYGQSFLGLPVSDEYINVSGYPQSDFEGGYITTLDGVNYQAFPSQTPPQAGTPVGSAGGVVQSENFTITVPPAVVPDGSVITIVPLDPVDMVLPPVGEGLKSLAHFFELTIKGPDGSAITNFATPLQICMTYTIADLLMAGGNPWNLIIGTVPTGGTTWQLLPLTSVDYFSMRVCTTVTHLSLFGLFVPNLPATGFAPGQLTLLPEQPAEKSFSEFSDLWLEIPSQGVQAPIVGVPFSDNGWDVSWLSNQIGWLEGTAFPTWAGNSALTAHIYDANGEPGPFVNLGSLLWGQKIIVHAWGQKYIYEVRSIWWWTKSDDLRPLQHEEYPWLTLITCRGYDEESDTYRWRTVVRAVQVSIEDE